MNPDDARAINEYVDLCRYAEGVLGERGWRLLCSYGRVMDGPYSGRYVSAIPMPMAKAYVDALARGEDIEVHLMHRHVSGLHEASRTRFERARLWMLFGDRTELA